jgi:hypothetical protein
MSTRIVWGRPKPSRREAGEFNPWRRKVAFAASGLAAAR